MISINEILKLSVSERLLLLDKIWNSIPSEKITLNDAQKKELDARIERVENGEAQFFSWKEVKQKLRKNNQS